MEVFGPGFFESSAKGVSWSPLRREKALFTGMIYFLHSRRQKRVNVPSGTGCLSILIQSNQYAIVGYFGVACPGPNNS